MRYWILFLISYSLSANTYDGVFISGNSDNRCDIVILQPNNESPTLPQDVAQMWDDTCEYYPFYGRYKNFFNVHVISRDDLVIDQDWKSAWRRREYFEISDKDFKDRDLGITIRDLGINAGAATSSLLEGGRLAWMTSVYRHVFAHEMGHLLANLADTYKKYGKYTNWYPANVILPDHAEIFIGHEHLNPKPQQGLDRWKRWQGYTDPVSGIHIGEPYMDVVEPHPSYPNSTTTVNYWRPSSQPSLMNNLSQPFDAVAREQMVLSIHKYIDPLDSYSDNNLSINDFDILEANVVDKDVIDVLWSVNGEPISNQHSLVIKDLNLTQDTNITLTAWDNTLNDDYETDDRGGWVRTSDFLTTYSTHPNGLDVIVERDESNKLTQIIHYNYVKNSEIKKWHDLIPYAVANWKQSNWFGIFAIFEGDWIYHEKLAWVYVHQAEQGLWLYLEGEGWHWTSKEIYPYIYSFNDNIWRLVN
jgi:hypothetical protein